MTATVTVLPLPVPAPRRPESADPTVVPQAASLLALGFTPESWRAACPPDSQLAARIALAMTDLLR